MNIHKNARLTPVRRGEMALAVISGRLSQAQAARDFGVSAKIVGRWTERFRAEGRDGMQDRSLRPRMSPTQTTETLAARILTHRRLVPLRSAHCRVDRGVARHRQPGSEARGSVAAA